MFVVSRSYQDRADKGLQGQRLVQDDDTGSFNIVIDYELGEEGLIDLSDRTEMTFTGMANGVYKLMGVPPGFAGATRAAGRGFRRCARRPSSERCRTWGLRQAQIHF